MRIRITNCPVADLVRVQVNDEIRYVRRTSRRADGNTGRDPDVAGEIIRLVQGDEPGPTLHRAPTFFVAG